jgi:hypothetical protein
VFSFSSARGVGNDCGHLLGFWQVREHTASLEAAAKQQVREARVAAAAAEERAAKAERHAADTR